MVRKIDFSGVDDAPAGPICMAQFVDGWMGRRRRTRKSWDTDQSRINSYLRPSPLWAMDMANIKPRHIAGIIEALSAAGLSPSTVRRAYSLLSVIFKDAAVRGHVSQTPCILGAEHLPKKAQPSLRNKVITMEEFRMLLSASTRQRGGIYAALMLTGARVGEVSGLTWADYDRARKPLGSLAVSKQFHTRRGKIEQGTKTGAIKALPVHPALCRILAQLRLANPAPDDAPIFLTAVKRQNWRSDVLRTALKADLARAGLDTSHTTHDFRHSFITHALAAGTDPRIVRRITHPAPRDILDTYSHHNWATLCGAVSSIKMIPGLAAL